MNSDLHDDGDDSPIQGKRLKPKRRSMVHGLVRELQNLYKGPKLPFGQMFHNSKVKLIFY